MLPVIATAQSFPFIKDKRVQKIKLLESTDKDIDRIFGRHIPYLESVKVKGGLLTIYYSFGKCSESKVSDWDVPNNVVIEIGFNPSKEIKADSLNLDFSKLRLTFESMHDLPLFSYWNDELGVKYIIDKGWHPIDYLHSVSYYPSNKFEKFKCPERF